jgi:hypothetical protein
MHRDETDIRVVLHESLRAVAVMHVPVDDQNPLRLVSRTGVVGGNRNIAEQAEAHRTIAQRMMSRRAYCAEAPRRFTGEREVNAIEHGSDSRASGIPRPFTRDGVRVELPTAGERRLTNGFDVRPLVRERQFIVTRVTPLDVSYE